jgi:hypothetical protein
MIDRIWGYLPLTVRFLASLDCHGKARRDRLTLPEVEESLRL